MKLFMKMWKQISEADRERTHKTIHNVLPVSVRKDGWGWQI